MKNGWITYDKYSTFVYCDFDEKCYATVFDMRPLLKISELSPNKYDIVVISYSSKKTILAATKLLEKKGFLKERIVPFVDFFYTNYANPLSRFLLNKASNFDTLLFGMSHSQNGLFFSKLGHSVFPFVGPSLDLFLYKKYLEIVTNEYSNLSSIRDIVIEMPYYFFNYDLSMQKNFVKTKMYYFASVNDFHHIDSLIVKRFGFFASIFDIKTFINKNSIEKNRDYLNKEKNFKLLRRIKKVLFESNKVDLVWKKEYLETLEENKVIFSELLNLVKNKIPNAKITIIVMPLNRLFRIKNRKVLKKSKKVFYSIISHFNNIEIRDYSDMKIEGKFSKN